MDNFLFLVNKYKDLIEVLYFLVVIVGVVIAYIQLRANTKAQQALRSPLINIYCPKHADPINGLTIRNVGDIIATNITIFVSEEINPLSRIILFLRRKRVPSSKKWLSSLEKEEMPSIYNNNIKSNLFSNIKVEITYHSPFHHSKMKMVNKFKRDNNV